MKVVVVGGGIVGLFSAYWLARRGAAVTLLERRPVVASETSEASAGIMAPGHSHSWASPATLRQLPAILGGRSTKMSVSGLDPTLVAWGARFVRSCTRSRWEDASLVRWRLARRSLALLEEVAAEAGLDGLVTWPGALFVHDDAQALQRHYEATELYRSRGEALELLGRSEVLALEPCLAASRATFAGGIYNRTAAVGECAAFGRALAGACADRGVELRTAVEVEGLDTRGRRVTGVRTASRDVPPADAYVLATGAFTGRLLGLRGWSLAVHPVQGYALTWSGLDVDRLPRVPGVDETRLLGWAAFGDRLRVTGVAAFGRRAVDPEAVAHLRAAAGELFGWLADADAPEVATGYRAVTADGMPRIGRAVYDNCFVNTGHANQGWTLSCGAGHLLAERMARATRSS